MVRRRDFPERGVGTAVGSRGLGSRLLARSGKPELMLQGQRVIGAGHFRHPTAVKCEHAHGQAATWSHRQTCKWLGGPSRRLASRHPDKRSLSHLVHLARGPVVMLMRCQTGISANGRMVDLAHGHAGRSADRQVVKPAARQSGDHVPCRSGKRSAGGPAVKQATGQTCKQPNRRPARLFRRETRREPRHAAPQQQASPNSLGKMKICGPAHNLRRNLFDDHTTICLLSAPVARRKCELLQRVRLPTSRDHGR